MKEKKATIFHGGNETITAITTNKLGEGIARLLLNPTPYLNKTVRLTTIAFKQNDILRLFEKKTGEKWTIVETTTAASIEFGKELAKTQPLYGIFAIVGAVMYDNEERYAPVYTKKDADELGLEQDDLEEVVDSVLAEAKDDAAK